MSAKDRMAQETEHTKGRIIRQLQAGDMVTVFNVPLLRVWKKAATNGETEEFRKQLRESKGDHGLVDSAVERAVAVFPPGDYEWYENPKLGDDYWSVIVPISSKAYWESIRYNPKSFMSTGTYDFDIEEVHFNLNLTRCEAARFLQEDKGDQGQVHVLRDIARPVRVMNRAGMTTYLRGGFQHIFMAPTEDTHKLTVETVGSRLVDIMGSPYRGLPMREVPEEHLERMAIPGGLGFIDPKVENLGRLELERRKLQNVESRHQPETVPDDAMGKTKLPPPLDFPVQATPVTPENQCVAMAKSGARCRRKGTVEYDSKLYCTSHAPVTASKADSAGRGDY